MLVFAGGGRQFRRRSPHRNGDVLASTPIPQHDTRGRRLAAIGLAGLSALVLASVLVAEHGFGLLPCPLCIQQRWPWMATLGIGAVAAASAAQPALWRGLVKLAALILVGGAILAVYHSGVERGWWPGPASCAQAEPADSLEALRAALLDRPIVACDAVPWSFLGLSMANYNLLLSLAVAVLCGLAVCPALTRSRSAS